MEKETKEKEEGNKEHVGGEGPKSGQTADGQPEKRN